MLATVLTRIGRILLVVFLESIAVFLALYQGLSGVQTDEAKYLLNIPYPHPPLARSVFHTFELVPEQEMMVRIVLASLLIQAVWLVGLMAKNLTPERRMTLCGLWLFSASVLLQAGTVMMAPLTALQGLFFVWLLFRQDLTEKYAGWIALFWLGSLFTAYQSILYFPIVVTIFWRLRFNILQKTAAVCIPILLAILYVSTNPLAIESFANGGTQNVMLSLSTILKQTASSWWFAGSAVLSIVGTIAVLRSRSVAPIGSFFLVVLFLCVSYRAYYSILFLPLFIGGIIAYPSVLRHEATLLALQILMAVYVFSVTELQFYENTARKVMRTVNQVPAKGSVLIAGGFGHQWQYESFSPVYRYRPELLSKAKAVVCLEACPGVSNYGFYQVGNLAQEVWVRK